MVLVWVLVHPSPSSLLSQWNEWYLMELYVGLLFFLILLESSSSNVSTCVILFKHTSIWCFYWELLIVTENLVIVWSQKKKELTLGYVETYYNNILDEVSSNQIVRNTVWACKYGLSGDNALQDCELNKKALFYWPTIMIGPGHYFFMFMGGDGTDD
jgi:hypothetical protein